MKRIISIVIMTCLLMTFFTTFTFADSSDVKITSVTYSSDNSVFTLNVNGICAPKNNISLVVKNKNGIIKAIEQFKVKDASSFSYEVEFDTNGDESLMETDGSLLYTVYVRNYSNKSDSYVVPLFTEGAKLFIVGKFNDETDITKMTGLIETYGKVFGFDSTYFNGAKDSVSKFMLLNKPFTVQNIVDKYNDSVIRAYLFAEDKTADRISVIEYDEYDKILHFDEGFDGAKSLYPYYKAMTNKNKVNEIAFSTENSMKSFVTIKENFFMAITSVVFTENKEDLTKISEFLGNYNDWFNLNRFTTLKTYELSNILDELCDKQIPDNKADFVNLYNAELNKIPAGDGTGAPPPIGGGGGGGSAGGSIGAVTDTVGFEQVDSLPESKPVEKVSFTDIGGYDWAREAIETLASKGVVNGRGDNKFAPADYITREEFAKILSVAYGLYDENAVNEFTDVSAGRWSYSYISSMYKNGIITGYSDGAFKPDSFVTREEMAVMLCRVLVRLGKIDNEYKAYSSYNDFNNISSFAVNSVLTLSNHNILSGDDTGCFNPKKGATRAEICKMIYNTGL
ncbi:MAG: S-layer homology domain-containing protein [Clostridia bacterium]|nr:S-layer homology domain-containing protein [Clostridia bacterium]